MFSCTGTVTLEIDMWILRQYNFYQVNTIKSKRGMGLEVLADE